MRLLALLLVIATLGCASAPALADPAPLQPFAGRWEGQGTFRGAPSQVTATFAPIYDGAAWVLDIDVRFAPPSGPQRFQGRAAYALRDGALAGGSWIDSFGNAYAISPRLEGRGLLRVDWGMTGVSGRSEYRLLPDGALEISDTIAGSGGERRFAVATLRRVSP